MNARINLAPEVYQSGQRDKQRRHLATTIGVGVSLVSVGLVIVAAVILGAQSVYIATLQKSITGNEQQLQQYADLQDAVTIQQHLQSLSSLSTQKVYMSKFFTVLQTFLPQGVAANTVTIGDGGTIELNASAKSYSLAGKLTKVLQGSGVTVGPNASASGQPDFTNVQLSSVADNGSGGVDFKVTAQLASGVTSGK